jgi:hypothetical protein
MVPGCDDRAVGSTCLVFAEGGSLPILVFSLNRNITTMSEKLSYINNIVWQAIQRTFQAKWI